MKIAQVMISDVKSCSPDDRLDVAARIMWDGDCGCVPVIDRDGLVAGIVTDRDACMAAYTQNASLSSIPVSAAMAHEVFVCSPDDPVESAEKTMQLHQVRRLPVVDRAGRLVGIVSLGDLARVASQPRGRRGDVVKAESVEETLAAICRPRGAIASA